jgi:hypothetical protein
MSAGSLRARVAVALTLAALAAGCVQEGGAACANDCSGRGTLHGDHCDCNAGYVARGLCCVAPTPCQGPDDALEDNDTVATATAVSGEALARSGLRVCPADADVFRVPLRVGQRVEVALTFTHARGDLDVYLYAPGVTDFSHARPTAASDGQRDNERLTHTATVAGEHLVLVQGFEGAQNTYDLSLRVTGP